MRKIYGVYGDLMQSFVTLVRLFQAMKVLLRRFAMTEDH
jgi:hypothetical protein